MSITIQLRHDTSSNWTNVNPVLAAGEAGYEIDTNKIKLGDGVTPWQTLAYVAEGTAGSMTKAEIDALGIDAATVTGNTVETSVPSGAVFTDTVYDDTEVLTSLSEKIQATDYASSTVGGTIKMRYDDVTDTLYITNDGTDA